MQLGPQAKKHRGHTRRPYLTTNNTDHKPYRMRCALYCEKMGGLGACSLMKVLNFIPSEIASGAFSDSFVVLK